ncbi:MAG: Ig-like domain-containing protein [Bacteroidota bacterium]|jgi:hypothetical protein
MHIRIRFSLLILFFALLVSCSKDDQESPGIPPGSIGNNQITFTPAPVQRKDGFIQPMVNRLVLHPNQSLQLTANVYDLNGNAVQTGAALSLSTNNAAVVSLSGSMMTTNKVGTASVWFSDNVRESVALLVEVVPDTVPLPTDPFSIQFSSPFLKMQSNTSQMIPTYTIRNLQGQIVGGSPAFYFENPNLGSINGNVIQSGGSSGMSTVRAVLNGDTLDGAFTMVNRNTTGSLTDTFWTIYPNKVTSSFHYYQRTADPIILDVVEAICYYGPGANPFPTINFYTASPLSMTVSNDKILNEENGRLVSVGPGLTQITAYYKGGSWLKWLTRVRTDLSGNWQFNAQNGKKITICFSQVPNWDGVFYTKWATNIGFNSNNFYYLDVGQALAENPDGSYDTTFEGTSLISRGAGDFTADSMQKYENFFVEVPSSGFLYSYTCSYYPISSPNSFTGLANGNNFSISASRVGDGCVGQGLQQVLAQDPNRIWSQGPNFMDNFEYMITDIQFNTSNTFIDHTAYDINDMYTVPGSTTWSTSPNSQRLILNYTLAVNQGTSSNPNYSYYTLVDSFNVSEYSSAKFNIKGVWPSDGQGYVNLSSLSTVLFWE